MSDGQHKRDRDGGDDRPYNERMADAYRRADKASTETIARLRAEIETLKKPQSSLAERINLPQLPDSGLRALGSQIIDRVIDGETRAYEIAKLIAAREAPLRDALRRALDVLEEHAGDEAEFWGKDHSAAKHAAEIYEQAKAALAQPNAVVTHAETSSRTHGGGGSRPR